MAAGAAEGPLQAGAAAVDITPPLGEEIVGGFRPFPATAVHDPLFARALVLDNGHRRLAIVIVDNLGMPREVCDAARHAVVESVAIDPWNVLIAATHTHSGTRASSPRYRPKLVAGIAAAVRRAVEQLEPAEIGWGAVDEPTEVFNRRWFVTDPELLKNPFGGVDKVRMNPPRGSPALIRPAGPTDPQISFVAVRAIRDGRPLALLAKYSLHYVGGVRRGDISADYFGVFARRVGALIGVRPRPGRPPFVGILSNGTSGDVNNIDFRNRSGKRYRPYEKMAEVAEKVARKVAAAYRKTTFRRSVVLDVVHRELPLRVRKPDEALRQYVEKVLSKPEDAPTYHRYERIYAQRVRRLDQEPDVWNVPLQALRIGDLAIVAIPFEVFAEIGLEIKRQTPFAHTFVIELANGSYGYLPTPRQHELGGYETWMGTNRVEKEASVKIVAAVRELLDALHSR
ncbi:MAG: hypothetical protein D6725_06160 [Planctomycetota bacterium]|nr:MAG: hypothetical protein D6725_06160 [Planctomycetota bacterium]